MKASRYSFIIMLLIGLQIAGVLVLIIFGQSMLMPAYLAAILVVGAWWLRATIKAARTGFQFPKGGGDFSGQGFAVGAVFFTHVMLGVGLKKTDAFVAYLVAAGLSIAIYLLAIRILSRYAESKLATGRKLLVSIMLGMTILYILCMVYVGFRADAIKPPSFSNGVFWTATVIVVIILNFLLLAPGIFLMRLEQISQQKRRKKRKAKFKPGKNLKESIRMFEKALPKHSLMYLEGVLGKKQYHFLPSIEEKIARLPKLFFFYDTVEVEEIKVLHRKLSGVLDGLLARNAPFLESFPAVFCKECGTRAKKMHFGNFPIIYCKSCETDNFLIPNVQQVVGRLSDPDRQHEGGNFYLRIWDEATKSPRLAEIDHIEILPADSPEKVDWAVTAFTHAWLEDKYYSQYSFGLILPPGFSVQENTMRLVQSTQKQVH